MLNEEQVKSNERGGDGGKDRDVKAEQPRERRAGDAHRRPA